MYNKHYTETIKREFLLFLLRNNGIYPKVSEYIFLNWKEDITVFLNKQIPVLKRPQRLLNIAFNFYSTKEGYGYWEKVAQEWKGVVFKNTQIKDAIKIRRK